MKSYAILYHTQIGVHQLTIEADEAASSDTVVCFYRHQGEALEEVAQACLDGIIAWHLIDPKENLQ